MRPQLRARRAPAPPSASSSSPSSNARRMGRSARPARAPFGFTLIELMVAIAVLALVAVLGWRGLDGIIRSRVTLTAQLERSRGMQLAFAQMQSDLEHLARPDLLHQRKNLVAANDRLTLVRTVVADNEAIRMQVVAYRITDGVLSRRETIATRDLTVLDASWQATLGDTDNSASVVLQGDVAAMTVKLWEGMNWRDATGDSVSAGLSVASSASTLVVNMTTQSGPSGLQVALQMRNQDTSLVKVFLLGGV